MSPGQIPSRWFLHLGADVDLMKQRRLFEPEPEPTPWEAVDRAQQVCAQIVFNRPLETPFDYLIPEGLQPFVKPGMRLRVPFGRGDQAIVGYCVGVGRPSATTARLKSVLELIDQGPILSPQMLELTRWIADRYLCGWGQVLEAVIPAGVKNQAGTRRTLLVSLDPAQPLGADPAELPAKQAAALAVLQREGRPMGIEQLARLAQCGVGPINALRQRGLLQSRYERIDSREAGVEEQPDRQPDLQLNVDQQRVLNEILQTLRAGTFRPFLLHGVTGSGKTEVYIRAIREVVEYGRQAIVLVPEISLTPQTIRRFRSRFDSVAVLHSHQSDAERHRHWQQIASGRVQVVVGARSAVFAPTPHLGLIVIDEEHEHSFKQDTVPRYHAREVALERSRRERVPLILGSATPTLEAWQRAQQGEFTLLSLQRRAAGLRLPPVHLVDTREDPVFRGGAAIGRALRSAMQQALHAGGQVILFLNLRGFCPVLWCQACGAPIKCPHCDVSLTWHREHNEARCHSCEYSTEPPRQCPACGKPGVRYLGTGTQRLESEVRAKFPGVSCVRMDSDSMRKPGSHDAALESFRTGQTKILLGTQMISKGLDFPNVTLVGVIDADTVLHQPDLRSGERTFQLIAQVAGRTGRGTAGGRVLVQTACPQEPPIQFAARHDYLGFVQRELRLRRQMGYPPFESLIRVILRGPDESEVNRAAQTLGNTLRGAIDAEGLAARILGPAPAPVTRLKNLFRYHLQLAAPRLETLQTLWRTHGAACTLPTDIELAIDVDPINLR